MSKIMSDVNDLCEKYKNEEIQEIYVTIPIEVYKMWAEYIGESCLKEEDVLIYAIYKLFSRTFAIEYFVKDAAFANEYHKEKQKMKFNIPVKLWHQFIEEFSKYELVNVEQAFTTALHNCVMYDYLQVKKG